VDGHTSEIGLGFGQVVSRQFNGAKAVKRSKRKARNEEKKKKEKSRVRRKRCGIWTAVKSDLLHRTQWNRTKISGVLFMQQSRKICTHSSAESVAISA
jgi:hypothetical protein